MRREGTGVSCMGGIECRERVSGKDVAKRRRDDREKGKDKAASPLLRSAGARK